MSQRRRKGNWNHRSLGVRETEETEEVPEEGGGSETEEIKAARKQEGSEAKSAQNQNRGEDSKKQDKSKNSEPRGHKPKTQHLTFRGETQYPSPGVGNLLSTEGCTLPFLRGRGPHDYKNTEEILLAHYILIYFAVLLCFIFLSKKVYMPALA